MSVRTRMTEWYDLSRVSTLLEIMPQGHHDTKTLRHIITHADPGGFIDTIYQHGHGLNFGRVYAPSSFQKLTTDVRNFICNDQLIDIDMENCYPSLLMQIFQRNDIETPILKKYVDTREEIIMKIQDTHPHMDRDAIKLSFIVALHNGNYMKHACSVQIQLIDEFRIELKRAITQLAKKQEFVSTFNLARDNKKKKKKRAHSSHGYVKYKKRSLGHTHVIFSRADNLF